MYVLIVDTEGKSRLCEFGAILYDTKTKRVIQVYSSLVPHDNVFIGERYKQRHTASLVVNETTDMEPLRQIVAKCDVILAHNLVHDRSKLRQLDLDKSKPWVCTVFQIQWPLPEETSLNLDNLCHIYNVTNVGRHTALGDCYALLHCLLNVQDFEEQLEPYVFYNPNSKYKRVPFPTWLTKKLGYRNYFTKLKPMESKSELTEESSISFSTSLTEPSQDSLAILDELNRQWKASTKPKTVPFHRVQE